MLSVCERDSIIVFTLTAVLIWPSPSPNVWRPISATVKKTFPEIMSFYFEEVSNSDDLQDFFLSVAEMSFHINIITAPFLSWWKGKWRFQTLIKILEVLRHKATFWHKTLRLTASITWKPEPDFCPVVTILALRSWEPVVQITTLTRHSCVGVVVTAVMQLIREARAL